MPDLGTLAVIVAALVVAGAAIGFLAGLFGIGGGAISVPVFFEVFRILGHEPQIAMPLAVGTSLAVIVPTSISSARGHYKRGTVDMAMLRVWAVPILIGVLLGSAVARYASPAVFQIAFIMFGAVIATKMLFGNPGWRLRPDLPSKAALRLYGLGIGLVSALMGIGGGAFSTLVLTLHGVAIHRAVSTSAGVGVLIAIPGALGYMAAGFGRPDLPADAIGFVSLATFALTIPTSMLTANLGVRAAHALSRSSLEIAFGLFLILVCLRFIVALVR